MVAQKKQVRINGKISTFLHTLWLTTLAQQKVRLCVQKCSNTWCISSIFIFTHTEEGFGEHQCPFGLGHEIRQILLGLQANLENIASRQSQIDHHCQQHATAKVKREIYSICIDYWEVAFSCNICLQTQFESIRFIFETIWSRRIVQCVTEKYVFKIFLQ